MGVDDKTKSFRRTLAGLAQWLECQPMHKEPWIQFPVNGMCLGCRLDPPAQVRCLQKATK